MAREAIEQVKKAEEEGREIIEQARNTAKKTVQDAEVYSKERYREIITKSKEEADSLIRETKQDANEKAQEIIDKGKEEADYIRNIDVAKIEGACKIVIERIVK